MGARIAGASGSVDQSRPRDENGSEGRGYECADGRHGIVFNSSNANMRLKGLSLK